MDPNGSAALLYISTHSWDWSLAEGAGSHDQEGGDTGVCQESADTNTTKIGTKITMIFRSVLIVNHSLAILAKQKKC